MTYLDDYGIENTITLAQFQHWVIHRKYTSLVRCETDYYSLTGKLHLDSGTYKTEFHFSGPRELMRWRKIIQKHGYPRVSPGGRAK